ncbi:predicted protein [Uncinocarpus reesii 1704]|uniref:Uncharacterized protein n=1 Tax=Uncinocarpus reesii (strain UAMH 1704) TaxID=336963 RepID=C4JKY5_UNCRE|nr:uncharacterized protein UREG_00185 [Uncinocarpus reesii 1704]EEP75339.1 predicted protein [Uncinocarpus reesii 1704]
MDLITKHKVDQAAQELFSGVQQCLSRYITEKTTIPIRRLYGYSIDGDKTLGLPFILMEFIEGNTLYSMNLREMDRDKRKHLYAQMGDVYIQLYRQQFDRIGALTLDENGGWTFTNNRPLTVDINAQEVAGHDICRFLPPNRTFNSTIDYLYMITKLISNDFYGGRDCIVDEDDARWYLYSIFTSQGILMERVKPEYNHGPFIWMHRDPRPPNIVFDENFNLGMELYYSSSNVCAPILAYQ